MQLDGKIVVLTGAAGGIGQAISQQLAASGCRLVLVGRKGEVLAKLQRQLNHPERHHHLVADITTDQGRSRLQEHCAALPNGIDILINGAGVSEFNLLDIANPRRIEATIATNLIAPMLLCHLLLPLLMRRREAAIVNIGSTFGSIGYPGFSSYCASKFGLRGFSESLRRELSDSTVQVLYFAPRATETPLNSSAVQALNDELNNRTDSPQKVAANLVRYLRKSRWHDTYLGWPEKLFVRINSLLPKLVDSALGNQLPVVRRHCRDQRLSETETETETKYIQLQQ